MAKFIYKHRFGPTVEEINSKANSIEDTEIVLAKQDEKIAFKNANGNIVTISSDAYNAEQIADFFDGAEYIKDDSNKTYKIVFKHGDEVKAEIDASDFIKDGMIENVKIEDGKLKITFNTDSGKEEIDIELTDIFNPDNYYTKENVDALLAEKADTATTYAKVDVDTILLKKTDREVVNGSNKALIFNETDGGGAKFENADGTDSYVGVNDGGANGIAAQIYAINRTSKEGARIDINPNAMYYTVGPKEADRMVPENEIAVKGDFNGYYTQEDVDALLAEKEEEIGRLNLRCDKLIELVINANVFKLPDDGDLKTLIKKDGLIELTTNTEQGCTLKDIVAKNIVTLKPKGKKLTVTGVTQETAAISVGGSREITVEGSGTIETENGPVFRVDGANALITLNGSAFGRPTYITNSSTPLIFCVEGTVIINEGIFKNLGENKAYLLNCLDENYKAGKAKIIVTGGKFYDFNPADNSAEGEHTNFVAEGYHVEVSQDGDSTVYTVKKD